MSVELCGFGMAWVGPCREPKATCEKHKSVVCRSCGAPATHECEETGQFVCGEPLCNDCEHTIFLDGCNGGVGFNAMKVPEGMKRHCKKDEQKFKPWYAQESGKA